MAITFDARFRIGSWVGLNLELRCTQILTYIDGQSLSPCVVSKGGVSERGARRASSVVTWSWDGGARLALGTTFSWLSTTQPLLLSSFLVSSLE